METTTHLIAKESRNEDILFPFVNGEDLNSRPDHSASRWIINFFDWPLSRAEAYPDCIEIVRKKVFPTRRDLKDKGYRERWWQYARRAVELYETIQELPRVLAIAGTSRTLAFVFMSPRIVFSHATRVFALHNGWHFAVLQSALHEYWVRQYSSRMKEDQAYFQSDCFDNFPFPARFKDVLPNCEEKGGEYYSYRFGITSSRQIGLTQLYNHFNDSLETSRDIQELRRLHVEMDQAVAAAYGWTDLQLEHGFHETKQGVRFTISEAARREVLDRLLKLNHQRYAEEKEQGLHNKTGATKKAASKKKTTSKADKKVAPLFDMGDDDE